MGAIAVVRLLHRRRSDRDTLACQRTRCAISRVRAPGHGGFGYVAFVIEVVHRAEGDWVAQPRALRGGLADRPGDERGFLAQRARKSRFTRSGNRGLPGSGTVVRAFRARRVLPSSRWPHDPLDRAPGHGHALAARPAPGLDRPVQRLRRPPPVRTGLEDPREHRRHHSIAQRPCRRRPLLPGPVGSRGDRKAQARKGPGRSARPRTGAGTRR